jgi:hypothetical protein
MSLAFFTVTAVLKAIRTDGNDAGGDPDTQFISSTVWFTPSVLQIHSAVDSTVYRLQPIRTRTDVADGVLRTIDGSAVKLVANNSAIALDELFYDVTFTDVVYDRQPEPVVDGFRFLAPTSATSVDLATVPRLALPRRH